jgi:uroporphyrinogen decarboxylase
MPILDQLVGAEPNAIHSLDPMAGVDIKKVKELVGDKVCLIGNVNCALMQTGTEQQVIDSAEYCLKYGKPNGGYIYSTSNVPFKGLPLERYLLVLDVWKKHRKYQA